MAGRLRRQRRRTHRRRQRTASQPTRARPTAVCRFNEELGELRLIGGDFGSQGGTAALGTNHRCVGGMVARTGFGPVGDLLLTDPLPLTKVDWKSDNLIPTLPVDGVGSQGRVEVRVNGRWQSEDPRRRPGAG